MANINKFFMEKRDAIKFVDDYKLKLKEKLVKKNLNQNHGKQELDEKNLH